MRNRVGPVPRASKVQKELTESTMIRLNQHPPDSALLNLNGLQINDYQVFRILLQLERFPDVRAIDLSDNKITSFGVHLLINRFQHRSEITNVKLQNNDITIDAIKEVARSLSSSKTMLSLDF